MRSAARRALVVSALAAVPMLGTSPALAAPMDTPAGTGGGCQENGQAVSSAAQALGVGFGQLVRTQAPIADDVRDFFVILCGGRD